MHRWNIDVILLRRVNSRALLFALSVVMSAVFINTTAHADSLNPQDSLFTVNLNSVCKEIAGDDNGAVDDCKRSIPPIYDDCKIHPDPGAVVTDPKYLAHCISERAKRQNNNHNYPTDKLQNLFKGPDGDPYDASSVACRIGDQIGWLVCPASSFLAKITDGVRNFLANFLRYDSLTNEQNPTSGNNPSATSTICATGGGVAGSNTQPIECAWSQMRNLANIIFVIMFALIIYSQITGFGFSNYNIKKMLPRLIVASILVNTSYWLCALAVDISNVVGNNLYEFLSTLGRVQGSNADTVVYSPDFGTYMAAILGGSALILFAGAALTASGALLATLSFMLPIMISALVACLTVIIILIARQGIITMLIVISPLAFVMMLLPNTQKWFDRWKDMFYSMLILFPLVAAVFGGATLAATVVRLADTGVLSVIFSLGIQTIPLFIIPSMLISTSGMLGKVGLLSNNKSKGIFDRANNRAQLAIKNRQTVGATKQASKYANNPPKGRFGKAYRHMRAGTMGRKLNKEDKQKDIEATLGQATDNYNNSMMQDYDRALQAAGGNEDVARRMQGAARQAEVQREAKTQDGLMKQLSGKNAKELTDILHNQDKHTEDEIGAALQQLIKIGDPTKMENGEDVGYAQFVDKFQAQAQQKNAKNGTAGGTAATRASARALQGSAYLGGGDIASIANGSAGSFSGMVQKNVTAGIAANKLAGAGSAELGYIEHLGNTIADPGKRNDFRKGAAKTAKEVMGKPEIRNTVGKGAGSISRMSTW